MRYDCQTLVLKKTRVVKGDQDHTEIWTELCPLSSLTPPLHWYVEVLIHNGTLFGDKAYKKVIKVKWGHRVGIQYDRLSVLIRRDTREPDVSLYHVRTQQRRKLWNNRKYMCIGLYPPVPGTELLKFLGISWVIGASLVLMRCLWVGSWMGSFWMGLQKDQVNIRSLELSASLQLPHHSLERSWQLSW